MRFFIILSFLVLQFLNSYCQSRFDLNFKGTIKTLKYDDIKGSPYRYSKFIKGDVFFKSSNEPVEYELNYNAFKDELDYTEDGTIYTVINQNKIKKINVKDEVIVYQPYYQKDLIVKGYFIEIIDDFVSLYKRETISTITQQNFTSKETLNSKIRFQKNSPKYYISIYGNSLILIRNKKQFIKLFFNSHIVKDYLKDENVNLHSEDDLKKLIIFLNHYDKRKNKLTNNT